MSKDSKLPKENVKPPRLKQEESDSDDESVSSLVSLNSSAASSTSSNRDVCPICLGSFRKQVSARPDVCEHKFCLECLEEWSKVSLIFDLFFHKKINILSLIRKQTLARSIVKHFSQFA